MKRCKYCGHILIPNELHCRGCGYYSEPIEDKSLADYALWLVIGAILNIFTIVLYVIIKNKKPKEALSALLGMILLFVNYGIFEIINLIFK